MRRRANHILAGVKRDWERAGHHAFSAAALAVLAFTLYSNSHRHAFHLDDAYTVVTNPSIRSLANVPRFFVDPSTYTSLREQADYRPLLQATYALDYHISGYDTRWWHFTQVALHVLVALGVYAFVRRLLTLLNDPPQRADRIALFAAAVFVIHPAASGVVNYFNARSSLLTAALLLPALLAYMTPSARGTPGPQWATAGWLSLALFAKVEAIGALGTLWAIELWERARGNPGVGLGQAVRSTFDRRTLTRMAPALFVAVAYLLIRAKVMAPFPFDETRHAPDVGAYEYFITQLTAWWHYVARWIAPLRLVADDLAYPVRRSLLDPVVLLALGAWLVVAASLVAMWKRAPHLLVLALVALALVSPTSSVAPLAEMVNEHRPYLPVGLLCAALLALAARRFTRWHTRAARTISTAGIVMAGVSLALLTHRRNEVFATPATFWRDVLEKAPSSRAHLNYGLALAGANDLTGAMAEYRAALRLAPLWYYTHINMGILHARLGQPDSAEASYDRAVLYDRYSGHARTWRGEFFLARGDFARARDDFAESGRMSLQPYRNAKGLATAYAGMGDVGKSLEQVGLLIRLDSITALTDVPGISQPYFANPALRARGIEFYRRLEKVLPGTWWIPENIARLERLMASNGNDRRDPQVRQAAR